MNIFKFFKYLFKYGGMPSFKEWEKEQIEEENKRNKEVWHYECENGHKWESYSSPEGTYCEMHYGVSRTRCPECGCDRVMGNVYINEIKTNMGAMHRDFNRGRKIK